MYLSVFAKTCPWLTTVQSQRLEVILARGLARGLAHQACTWHEHLQRGAMSTQTPQTRSTTEQNTQQDSQYQGYLALKT